MRILIILLGCHIARLLNGRIEAAVELASSYHQQVDWLLSGGIKHNDDGASITEAQQMAAQISKKEPAYGTPEWNYILDTKATNTAENFLRIRDMDLTVYNEVYIATSEFHYERAAKIASLIIDDRIKKINWILAEQKEPDSEYWERIHIRNVEADVRRALQQRM
jgi:vancomycin permeability regulator SanA